jgi:hypothetical protein
MLVECGFTRVTASDGAGVTEFTFTPSFGRISTLGRPHEIVSLFASLHGPNAAQDATYVLACLCDQEDPTPLIGCWEDELGHTPGLMPAAEQIVVARHLMAHGIIGKSRPAASGSGQYSDKFDAAEYVAAARVHLGLSSADAEALSMSEFLTMFEMKFPAADGAAAIPSAEEYDAAMAALEESRRGTEGR